MTETLIPYVAQLLQRVILVQYRGAYARFAIDGTRQDYAGLAPFTLGAIRMSCRGNHFW